MQIIPFDTYRTRMEQHQLVSVEDSLLQEEVEDKRESILLPPTWKTKRKTLSLLPSEFTEWAIRVYYNRDYRQFTFIGREYLKPIYDVDMPHVLLKTSRQCEKSSTLGNLTISDSCLSTGYRTIYATPSNEQTKTFSRDRLDDILYTSEKLRPFSGSLMDNSLYLKRFLGTRAIIMLYYAYHNANRFRGKFADALKIDEFQDIRPDLLPVIQACLHHADQPTEFRSGTPLSLDNHIEKEWLTSTAREWAVPCLFCRGENNSIAHAGYIHSSWNWQFLTEENIGRRGPVCIKCRRLLNPFHPKCHWVATNPGGGPFEGFHITQLMVPWIVTVPAKWDDLFYTWQTWPRKKFRNERLGISDDVATRPVTRERMQSLCCGARLEDLDSYVEWCKTNDCWMGIDWAPGETENSYTVVTLGTLRDGKMDVFYAERLVGEYIPFQAAINRIMHIIGTFNVTAVGADFGMGHDRNKELVRLLGHRRMKIFQYVTPEYVIQWSSKLGRFLVNKSEVLDALFMALRDGYFKLPDFAWFADPFAQDILNVFVEEREGTKHQFRYSHSGPDDTWHSLVFLFLASVIAGNPRLDILFPHEDPAHFYEHIKDLGL